MTWPNQSRMENPLVTRHAMILAGNGSQGKPQLEVTVRGEGCGGLVWGGSQELVSAARRLSLRIGWSFISPDHSRPKIAGLLVAVWCAWCCLCWPLSFLPCKSPFTLILGPCCRQALFGQPPKCTPPCHLN